MTSLRIRDAREGAAVVDAGCVAGGAGAIADEGRFQRGERGDGGMTVAKNRTPR